MPDYDFTSPEGKTYTVTAESPEKAALAVQYMMNPPPPGAMIHEPGRSYIVPGDSGDPMLRYNREGQPVPINRRGPLEVDTSKMAPSIASPELGGDLEAPNRATAAAALRMRGEGRVPTLGPREVQPFMQGISSSTADELASFGYGTGAAIRGGSSEDAYRLAQEAQRQDLAAEFKDNPGRATALQVGGAIAQAPYLTLRGPLAAAMSSSAPAARVLGGAVGGGILGALEGGAAESGWENRGYGAGRGALAGAALGGAAPIASDIIGGTYRRARDWSLVNRNLDASGLDINRSAADQLYRVANLSDALEPGGRGRQRIIDAGPEGMMLDMGRPAVGLLDYLASRGGPGLPIAERALETRGQRAANVLTDTLDRHMGGPPVDVATASNIIREGGRPVRETLWTSAYAEPINWADTRARTLESDLAAVPARVVAKANELMQLERVPMSQQIRANIADDGSVTFDRLPDVRQIDYIARGLRHMAETGEDAGKLGGRTQFSTAYGRLASDIRRTLGDLVPDYRSALQNSADEISWVQANKLGYDALKATTNRGELRLAWNDMHEPERYATRQGARAYIDDLMSRVKGSANAYDPQDAREAYAAMRSLDSRDVRQKLEIMLGRDDANALMGELIRVSRAAEFSAGMAQNAKTAGRIAGGDIEAALSAPGPAGQAARGKFPSMFSSAAQWAFGTRPQDLLGRTEATQRQVADVLTGPNPLDALDALRRSFETGAVNERMADLLGRSSAAVGGAGGYGYYESQRRR